MQSGRAQAVITLQPPHAELIRLRALRLTSPDGELSVLLTNLEDPARFPAPAVIDRYFRRWAVEDAFTIVKRLLGLAYFYCGAENAVQMQLWAAWLLYAVLIDLTDAVAEALARPFAEVSVEMVYRSLVFRDQRCAIRPDHQPGFAIWTGQLA